MHVAGQRDAHVCNYKLHQVVVFAVQEFTLMSNFIREAPVCTASSGVTFKDPVIIDAAVQSNGWDCGCHAIMNLRAVAHTAVVEELDWVDMELPTGQDAARDLRWRKQIAQECLDRVVRLSGHKLDGD